MPSIQESLKSNIDMQNYSSVDISRVPSTLPSNNQTSEIIRRSTYLRCPVPPIGNVSPDTLRQFYLNNAIPQRRTFI